MDNEPSTFSTTSRRLENFLYYGYRIKAKRHYVGRDLMTVWVYDETPLLSAALKAYAECADVIKYNPSGKQ